MLHVPRQLLKQLLTNAIGLQEERAREPQWFNLYGVVSQIVVQEFAKNRRSRGLVPLFGLESVVSWENLRSIAFRSDDQPLGFSLTPFLDKSMSGSKNTIWIHLGNERSFTSYVSLRTAGLQGTRVLTPRWCKIEEIWVGKYHALCRSSVSMWLLLPDFIRIGVMHDGNANEWVEPIFILWEGDGWDLIVANNADINAQRFTVNVEVDHT